MQVSPATPWGYSLDGLKRLPVEQEIVGSNPTNPAIFPDTNHLHMEMSWLKKLSLLKISVG